MCLTKDRSLLVTRGDDGMVYVWNLNAIRQQLAPMELDWDNTPPIQSLNSREQFSMSQLKQY
jgi:hypothetical protein